MILQGKMLVDAWNTNKESIDKNGDNIMQYVMLEGERDNTEAIAKNKIFCFNNSTSWNKNARNCIKICDWNTEFSLKCYRIIIFKIW